MPDHDDTRPAPNRPPSEIAFILRHAGHKPGARVMREMASQADAAPETTPVPPVPKRALRQRAPR